MTFGLNSLELTTYRDPAATVQWARFRGVVSAVLTSDLADPSEWWRAAADLIDDLGVAGHSEHSHQIADRMRAIAELIEAADL